MPNNLTKRQIIQTVYEGKNCKQEDVRLIVQETLNLISDTLAEGRGIELRNFGIFELQVRKARVGRNPKNPGTELVIPRRVAVKFKPGKNLREKLELLDLDELSS